MSSMTLHLKVHEGNEGLLRAGQAMLNGAAEDSRMPLDTRLRGQSIPSSRRLATRRRLDPIVNFKSCIGVLVTSLSISA